MRSIFLLTVLLLFPSNKSQSQTLAETSGDIGFDVDSCGRVTIYGSAHYNFSVPATSFLSVLIDSSVYTNSNQSPVLPKWPTIWKKATVFREADTITATWPISTGLIIIQRTYPVKYQSSNVVVLRFYAKNVSPVSHTAQCQYLLNVDNNNSPIYTERPESGFSGSFYIDSLKYRSFFFTSMKASFEPPNRYAQGIWKDSTLHLKKAWRATLDEWYHLIPWAFGPPKGSTVQDYADVAILNEWNRETVEPGDEIELGSMAFGAASPYVCFNYPVALVSFVNHEIDPVGPRSSSLLESFVWNLKTDDFLSTTVRLSVTAPLAILHSTQNTSGSQTQNFFGIPPSSFRVAAWTLLATGNEFDSTIAATLSFRIQGPLNYDCTHSVDVAPGVVVKRDVQPPNVQTIAFGSFDNSQCNMRRYEAAVVDSGKGIGSITATLLSNFSFAVEPFTTGDSEARYALSVIDSLKDADATVASTDVAGNTTQKGYHYCTIADRRKPSLRIEHNDMNAIDFIFSDDQPWDRGVDSAHLRLNVTNARLQVIGSNAMASPQLRLRATIIDPTESSMICVNAFDVLFNGPTDTCITIAGIALANAGLGKELTIAPNPAHDRLTVTPGKVQVSRVTVLDLLGKTMLSVTPGSPSPMEVDLTSLAAGAYIVRILTDTGVISRRIELVH